MPLRVVRLLQLMAVMLAGAAPALGPSAAAAFTKLVVFGDSLSDVGNVAQASFDIYPGPYYFNDRFSNGPVWVEMLATGLGLGASVRSTVGGDNYAYGGAQTTGTGGLEGIFIRDVDEQVTQFLNQGAVDAGALFVVFAGSNDFIGGQTNVSLPVSSLTEDIGRLVAAGARQLLVPNLPLLGLTPRFNDSPAQSAEYNARTSQFNAALDTALEGVSSATPDLTIYRLNVEALFTEAIGEPAKFGLINVTDPAAPGLQPGDSIYDPDTIVEHPLEYLFWDDLHPTTTVHAALAERARALVQPVPGDFNADAEIDGADLAVWRAGYGTLDAATRFDGDADGDADVDGVDLLIWQRRFDSRTANAAGASVTVAEPACYGLSVIAGCAAAVVRRRLGS